jgi:glycosyltransferase involved in cell wall biosynthesis
MKPLTILHTIETSGPGGAENVLLTLASRLDRNRFRPLVLINEPGWLEDHLHELELPVIRVEWKRWYDFRLPRAIAAVVRREGVNLIHSHLPDQNFYSCLAARLVRCPTIVTYHGAVELKDARTLRGKLKLRVVRQTAAAVVVVCEHVRQMLREIGFPAEKLIRIYNGVDLERFTPENAGGELRRELGCGARTRLVGMVANVRTTKGHEFFLRAARLVADRFPDTMFVISGDPHPTLSPPLFDLVNELGLQSCVRFLGYRSDVARWLPQLDAFVLPSTSEGFPLVVLEAMACARAVVATRCGGTDEMLVDNLSGLLVPVRDPEAIARGICELLCDDGRRTAMGVAARRHLQREFSIDAMLQQYERLYQQCVEAAPLTVGAPLAATERE